MTELAESNRHLAETVISLLGDPEQYKYFAEDIVFEFPYAESQNMPTRHRGKAQVTAYVDNLNSTRKGLATGDMVFYSPEGHPDTVFIEYESKAPGPGAHTHHQIYVDKMIFRDGKLVYMREFWDPKRDE
jgi:ketosteroid isomerase-like protein